MQHISMVQALSIWSDLEAAYYGQNGFGGDTAEIYEYRLLPFTHAFERGEEWFEGQRKEFHENAAASLRALVVHFEETHECVIEVVRGRTAHGPLERAASFLKRQIFDHRIHLRVSSESATERPMVTSTELCMRVAKERGGSAGIYRMQFEEGLPKELVLFCGGRSVRYELARGATVEQSGPKKDT